jgi:uncharacterized protein
VPVRSRLRWSVAALPFLLAACALRGPVTRTFSFKPLPLPGARALPAHWGFVDGVLETLPGADSGVMLQAWWIPSSREPARCGAALLLHGKGQNRAELAPLARTLSTAGFDVLVPDYRGYGGSTGNPTDSGVVQDAQTALNHLRQRTAHAPVPIVLVGHSMGTALTAHLAANEPIAARVFIAPFSSTNRLTHARFGWLGPRLFDSTEFDFSPARDVSRSSAKTLVAVAGRDLLIRRRVSDEFIAAISPTPAVVRDPKASHAGILRSDAVLLTIRDSLRSWLVCPGEVQQTAHPSRSSAKMH